MCRGIMVQLGIIAHFKRNVLEWDITELIMKEPGYVTGKTYITKNEMWEVVINTSETSFY